MIRKDEVAVNSVLENSKGVIAMEKIYLVGPDENKRMETEYEWLEPVKMTEKEMLEKHGPIIEIVEEEGYEEVWCDSGIFYSDYRYLLATGEWVHRGNYGVCFTDKKEVVHDEFKGMPWWQMWQVWTEDGNTLLGFVRSDINKYTDPSDYRKVITIKYADWMKMTDEERSAFYENTF